MSSDHQTAKKHFEAHVGKAMTMIRTEPTLTTNDLRTIGTPTLALVGDDDLITLVHTIELYESLPAEQLAVVPGTSPRSAVGAAQTRPARIVLHLLEADVAATTLPPIRREATSDGL